MAAMKPEREHGSPVAAYKGVLKRVVDNRPSGTRHRLALALGKNRSFISQITNPVYAVPIPPQHLDAIFEFLAAYLTAHPRRLDLVRRPAGTRALTVILPDLGDARRNRLLDEAILETARRLSRLTEDL